MIVKPFNKPESQFTQLHNSIFDVIMRICTNSEWKVLCAVLRKTRGWDKPGDDISYSQIKELTGVASNSTIATAVSGLIKKDMIIASKREGATTFYQLNQNYTIDLTSPKIGQVLAEEDDLSKNWTGTCTDSGHPTCPKIGHTKDSLNSLNKERIINQESSDLHVRLIQKHSLDLSPSEKKTVSLIKRCLPASDGNGTFVLVAPDAKTCALINSRYKAIFKRDLIGITGKEMALEIEYLDQLATPVD